MVVVALNLDAIFKPLCSWNWADKLSDHLNNNLEKEKIERETRDRETERELGMYVCGC